MLHLPDGTTDLDAAVQPRGYRLLARIPRLPESVIDRIVERFGNLPEDHAGHRSTTSTRSRASASTRARAIKEGLTRLAESSILDRYS